MRYSIIVLLLSFTVNSQGYFEGKDLNCPSSNADAMKAFDAGINVLHLNSNLNPKYLALNTEAFAKAILADEKFCDAYFFAGYTLRLQNKFHDACVMYKMADSLSSKPSLEFKTNLAAAFLFIGADAYARRHYQEVIEHFPESPEGYYGVAITSPIVGDYANGLEKIELTIDKYRMRGIKIKDDVHFIKAILLTLNQKYAESLELFDKVQSNYKNDENFNIHYSLSLLKVAETTSDKKLKDKAQKHYNKIKDKNSIPEPIRQYYVF